jgi:hypothetical protein
MTTLSLLDVFERPAILGDDPADCGHADDMDRDRVHRAGEGLEPESQTGRDHPVPASGLGGAPTLDDVLSGMWETLLSAQTATCLICEGPVEPRYGAGSAPVGGRCTRCGTEYS